MSPSQNTIKKFQSASVVAPFESNELLTEVAQIPLLEPNDNQLLIKTVACAVNPTDWKHILFKQGPPGSIVGSDCSGIVVKVGANVNANATAAADQGFQVGDIVSTFSHGCFNDQRGNFAEYVIADPSTTIRYKSLKDMDSVLPVGDALPGTITTFEGAAAVTLGVVTSVLSLVGNLNVQSEDKGKYILIWGGATATGVVAIQIAKLAFGLQVVTVASPQHHAFLKSIGADLIFDYHETDVSEQISKATKGEIAYVFDIISEQSSFQKCYDAYKHAHGPVKVNALMPLNESDLQLDDSIPCSQKRNWEIVTPTFAYAANGEKLALFGMEFQADESTLDRYNKFWNERLPLILPNIRHIGLKVLPAGLESTNEGLQLLQSNQIRGQKVVFRLR